MKDSRDKDGSNAVLCRIYNCAIKRQKIEENLCFFALNPIVGYINKPFHVSYFTVNMKRTWEINSLKIAVIIQMLVFFKGGGWVK